MRRNAKRDPKTGRFIHEDDKRTFVGEDEFFEDSPKDVDKRTSDKDIMSAIIIGVFIAFVIIVLLIIIF